MPSIDVTGLSKTFGSRTVVSEVSLTAHAREILGVLGPNGSGKTTLLRMICGLLTPSAGQGQVLGRDILADQAWLRTQVGYMAQRFSLYEDLTIRENLSFMARIHGIPSRRARIDEALGHLGSAVRPDQLAGTLSGGWKQRLALEACLLHAPRILLLDEPTAGVDPTARRAFWAYIQRIAARDVTVMVSTHYMDEAERCDRIAIVSDGRLAAIGTAPELAARSGLVAFQATGPDIDALEAALREMPGIAQLARFGDHLRILGRDAAQIERLLADLPQAGTAAIARTLPGIEDIFIEHTGGGRARTGKSGVSA
ncbi:ABC transporter ATP-binding protein [Roseivivax sp. CAU 1753]